MGIGTIDSLLNGRLQVQDWFKTSFTGQAVGGYHSPLYVAGLPGAGGAPSVGINGSQLNSRSGAITFPTTVAGRSVYLNGASLAAESGVTSAFLVDRMWENSGINVTLTSSQAIAAAGLPSRDANGGTLGVGVGIALEITSTIGAVATTGTVTYIDSDGNTGNTAVVNIPSGAVTGTWLPFPLAAGDYGCRGPSAFQLGASLLSGAISLVMYRRIGRVLALPTSNVADKFGPAEGGPLFDNTVAHWIYILSATSVGKTAGSIQFVQG